jgi:hypothetical protein
MLVSARDKATRQDYTKTIVVDLSGSNPEKVKALAQYLHATVASLPSDETRPDADIVVIFGTDIR